MKLKITDASSATRFCFDAIAEMTPFKKLQQLKIFQMLFYFLQKIIDAGIQNLKIDGEFLN